MYEACKECFVARSTKRLQRHKKKKNRLTYRLAYCQVCYLLPKLSLTFTLVISFAKTITGSLNNNVLVTTIIIMTKPQNCLTFTFFVLKSHIYFKSGLNFH